MAHHSSLTAHQSIAIVAGEASGDASGAALATELLRLQPGIAIWGAGGPRMREAGVELVSDFSWAGTIGIVESLKLVPRMALDLRKLKRTFLDRRPAVFVPIDFGAFNTRLGKHVRGLGIKSVYYFPPGSWRKRLRDPSRLVAAADKVIAPFAWSRDLLAKAGLDVDFLGHPILDQVAPRMRREAFLRSLNLPESTKIVGLLPGSRPHEIANILPVMLDAVERMYKVLAEPYTYLIAASSDKAKCQIDRIRKRKRPQCGDFRVETSATYDIMAYSDLLISCSGTATLEAMILGTPMIIVYRGSRLMKLEYMFRKGILEEFVGMPNIIAGRKLCPELLGDEASPETIARTALDYLQRPERLEQARRELLEETAVLGKPGATRRAAEEILQFAGLCSSR